MLERVQHNPGFARARPDEAVTLLLSAEPLTVRLVLRDLVAAATAMPGKSLHRTHSQKGNPSMDNLATAPFVRCSASRSRSVPSKRRKTLSP